MANDVKTAKIHADPGGEKPAPADGPSAPGATGAVNPAALTPAQAARLLTAAGAKFATVDTIRRHIERGAPTGPDGQINLIHYMAWVIREFSTDAVDED
jgi:hypothetical protein